MCFKKRKKGKKKGGGQVIDIKASNALNLNRYATVLNLPLE